MRQRTAQPRGRAEIDPEFLDNLLASFSGRFDPDFHKYVAASQRLTRVGRGSSVAGVVDGWSGGNAYRVIAADLQVIRGESTSAAPDFLVEIAASSSWTFQALIENPNGTGTNPGFWRVGTAENGTTFCIDNGATRRPWVRVNGVDVLKAAAGPQWPTRGLLNIIFRFVNATSVDVWWDGIKQHSATHATSQNALTSTNSIYQIGRQNAAEYMEGAWAGARFWSKALSDDQMARLARNPWEFYAPLPRRIYIPTVTASSNAVLSAAGTGAASWTGASNNSQPWTAAGTGVAAWTGGPLNSQPWTAAGVGAAAWVGASVSSGSADWAAAGVGAAAWTGAATADSVWASAALGDANWAGAGGAVTATTPAAGGGGARRRRRPEIHYVVIDGVDHRVSSVEEAKEILLKLRDVAAKRVQRQARKAVAKAPEAPVIQPIRATVKIDDYGTVFAQQLQAQVDAANAQIAEQYAQAVASAQAWQMHQRSLDDEDEEIETLILLGML